MKPTSAYGGLGIYHSIYHIATVEQLDELHSDVDWSLRFVSRVVWIKLKVHKPGDTVDCELWGQPITMAYEVAQYLAALHALEK